MNSFSPYSITQIVLKTNSSIFMQAMSSQNLKIREQHILLSPLLGPLAHILWTCSTINFKKAALLITLENKTLS